MKKDLSDPKVIKLLAKQHKWKARILSAGWDTMKQFCLDVGIDWDCFRDYRRFPLTVENTKKIESAIKSRK